MDSTKARQKGKSGRPTRPEKPRPDFPLFPHNNGQWAKKVKGQLHYFGVWADPQSALDEWLGAQDYLRDGKTPPPPQSEGLTVGGLVEAFQNAIKSKLDDNELSVRSWRDYHATCDRIIGAFGKDRLVENLEPNDFRALRSKLGKTRAKVALANEIGRVRVVFNFGNSKNERLYVKDGKEYSVAYGTGFAKPSRKTLRKEKNTQKQQHGKRQFEAAELRTILEALQGKEVRKFDPVTKDRTEQPVTLKVNPTIRAMTLLGINCALGQSDCANLTAGSIDFDAALIDFPRPKTGAERRCPLWPETVEALRTAIACRPNPAKSADGKYVFLTKYGHQWVRTTESDDEKKRGIAMDAVAQEFRKLLATLGINGKRNFYTLRRTFRTIADKARDRAAARLIMGHTADANDMDAVYVQEIENERLIDVSNKVREWLFSDSK